MLLFAPERPTRKRTDTRQGPACCISSILNCARCVIFRINCKTLSPVFPNICLCTYLKQDHHASELYSSAYARRVQLRRLHVVFGTFLCSMAFKCHRVICVENTNRGGRRKCCLLALLFDFSTLLPSERGNIRWVGHYDISSHPSVPTVRGRR